MTIMRILCGLAWALFLTACKPASPIPLSIQPDTLNEDWAVEWWLPRHEEKLNAKNQAQIDLVFIGDSITHGWEDAGKGVWAEYYERRHGFNLGFGGDRTENVLWRLDNKAVENLSPRLVVLMIGTNNTGHRMDPSAETVLGISAIIENMKSQLPDTQFLLLGVFPRGKTAGDPMRVRNDAINELLAKKPFGNRVHFRNINSVFLEPNGEIDEAIMPDLLHLSPHGYQLWAQAIDADVIRLMNDDSTPKRSAD
jgi:beta-glucosidase